MDESRWAVQGSRKSECSPFLSILCVWVYAGSHRIRGCDGHSQVFQDAELLERGGSGIGSLKLRLQIIDLGADLRDVDRLQVAELVLQIADIRILQAGL